MSKNVVKVLGIETSCDETAVAIVEASIDSSLNFQNKKILANNILSQIDIHKEFGGVVPEVAARNHLDVIDVMVEKTLKNANLSYEQIDAISATSGPGLIGGVIVGMTTGKIIASIHKKPFIAINHLEGHALTARFLDTLEFPYLLLLVSGGHCQILITEGVGQYKKLGETIDDAVGEAFDKVAQMLGLEYPGGPKIEEFAKSGNENRFPLPKPLLPSKTNSGKGHKFNFSFSGLKTAVRREIEKLTKQSFESQFSCAKLSKQDIHDICASFQKTVADIITDRLANVVKMLKNNNFSQNQKLIDTLVIAGGVAANQYIKSKVENAVKKYNFKVITPPILLCTDNGIMVAWAGLENFVLGKINKLDFDPKANWELEDI
ncbi:tRNA (adenosine(37)-N6)-threonylcarbamoyltransferase complex transferase subunit TsaD [Pseudomonadota bacterium]